MVSQNLLRIMSVISSLILVLNMLSCSTGIEESPNPGILRVTMQANSADTSIYLEPDTFVVSNTDTLRVTVFQGKVFKDSTFAVLYPRIESYQQQDIDYNFLDRENDTYQKFIIFESHVPPSQYNQLQFGVNSKVLKFGNFRIPVETPQNSFVNLYQDFEISENHITEVIVRVSPFQSVTRFRDTYRFSPVMEIVDVIYH